MKKINKEEHNSNLNAQIKDLKENSSKLMKEIKDLQPLSLAPDEVTILRKIREAVNVWGYDLIEKNETLLLYKKRELENTQKLIKKTEGMLI
ncbi:MAG: hypothetical protein Q7R87_01520 [Nanoarchaeota archaeon]|nr:hypothetical protein [Nanoarchaeota archaeon]